MAVPVATVLVEAATSVAMALSWAFLVSFAVLEGKAMPEHAFFAMLFMAILTMLVSIVLAGIEYVVRLALGTADRTSLRKPINKAYLAFPVPQLMGFLLLINYVVAVLGLPHIRGSGILQAILTQGSIPSTLLFSVLLLNRRYNWIQVLGAAIVIAGAVVSFSGDINSSSSSDSNSTDVSNSTRNSTSVQNLTCGAGQEQSKSDEIVWDILYFISTMPIGLLFIVMEVFLRYSKDDEMRRDQLGELNLPIATAINNFWLALWALAFFWLNLVPGIVPTCNSNVLTIQEFWESMTLGARCMFTGQGGFTESEYHQQDYCENAGFIVVFLSAVTAIQMILQAVTVQQNSASFSMILMTMGTIFSFFIQSNRTIMITDVFYRKVGEKIRPSIWGGLFVVLAGLFVYKLPFILMRINKASPLHPPISDETFSWLHRWLARRLTSLTQHTRFEESIPTNTEVQPLLKPESS